GMSRKKEITLSMGKLSIDQVIINLVSRLRFAHGKYHNNETMMSDALNLLNRLPPEHTKITEEWAKLGMTGEHAGDSQALIELYTVYCTHEKCIECPLGISLLQQKTHETNSQFV
ncbi:MAG: DUF2851 family protein, partial [Flavobacteriales bacterium]